MDDAAFIACARTALPELVEEVSSLRSDVERLTAETIPSFLLTSDSQIRDAIERKNILEYAEKLREENARLLEENARFNGPDYQYAGPGPIHRNAILCRNKEISELMDERDQLRTQLTERDREAERLRGLLDSIGHLFFQKYAHQPEWIKVNVLGFVARAALDEND